MSASCDSPEVQNLADLHDNLPPESVKKFRFPRIILRDGVGHKLDTYTTLQEAIYRDKWNIKQTQEARHPNEWRLPKAPPPARPDFTRRGPPAPKISRQQTVYSLDNIATHAPNKESCAKNVSFPASLAKLPNFIQTKFHDIEDATGEKIYLQIVYGLFLEKRYLSETIKKDSQYVFPGFCTGCRRAELCYGCERSMLLHTHQNYQSRTGGGYTYWKHDRVKSEISRNNPRNWSFQVPGEDDDNGNKSIAGESTATTVELYFVDSKKKLVLGNETGTPLDEKTIKELFTMKIWENVTDVDCDYILYQDESGVEILVHKNNLEQFLHLLPEDHPDSLKILHLLQSGSDSDKHLLLNLDPTSRLGTLTPSSVRELSSKEDSRLLADLLEYLQNKEDTSLSSPINEPNTAQRESLYKVPKPFKLKTREHQQIVCKSPFSTDRQFNIVKGDGLNIKKSTKELTQFLNMNKTEAKWNEPKKFELQKFERGDNFQRLQNGKDGRCQSNNNADDFDQGQINRAMYDIRKTDPSLSPDSGLDSEFMAESVKTFDSYRNDVMKEQNNDTDGENQSSFTGSRLDDYSGFRKGSSSQSIEDNKSTDIEDPISTTQRSRQETVKKSRRTRHEQKISQSSTKSVEKDEEENDVSFVFEDEQETESRKETLKLPTPRVNMTSPDLPTIEFQTKKTDARRPSMKFKVTEPPAMKQPPKNHKPPPKVRILPKMTTPRKYRKTAEALISPEDVRDIQDPLDFLAKYCIINPARLPFYELIFESAILDNKPDFPLPQINNSDFNTSPHQHQQSLSKHEISMLRDMTLIGHGQQTTEVGYTVSEECLKKINFTIESLEWKQTKLVKNVKNLEAKRIHLLATMAREEFPAIDNIVFSPRKNKGRQALNEGFLSKTEKLEVTDETIIERLDKKALAQFCNSDLIRPVDIEIERQQQKTTDVCHRLQQKQEERMKLGDYCEDDFINRQLKEKHPGDFRRQQSQLYNTLRPTPDYEITFENLRQALQQVNNHLLTDRECDFLYHVLDIPCREKINFRLFSVVAALSEKVTQLDPMIRRLMNKHDYKALNIKMDKCWELFSFLEDDISPPGEATAASLALELTAGGLTPEHTRYVLGKFNREGRGLIDFMDFVTYVPLFVEIHQRIIQDPLNEEQDL